MKLIIGFILGVVAYHYFPAELDQVATTAGDMVHEGANYIANRTK